ncbi:MAG: cobalt ECF transporter T component CbiQ [candidate division NC10 bacterium]|nr:cobalt ECF transporter T component CbiQ [candidate division NC10 bacterium]
MRPAWLVTKMEDLAACPCCTVGVGGKGFVERTLLGIASFFKEAIFSEEIARAPGFLQHLDPRVKLFSFALFLVAASLMKKALPLLGLYLFTLLLASASRITLGFFLKRVFFFIPLFSGLIALPALFLVPGEPLITFFSLGGFTLAITKSGLSSAFFLVLRVATSVSFAVLLVLTTRWPQLLKALRIFKLPQVFVLILGMTHRYLYLLIALIEEMHLAKKSRTIQRDGLRKEQRWVASRIGFLFGKSRRMADEVYQAMISRGFDGEARVLDTFRMTRMDVLWLGLSVLLFVLALWIGGIA